MKGKRKKKRLWPQPPYWVRLSLYAAVWPGIEFYDYRLNLQRKYIRAYRKTRDVKHARREIRREGRLWAMAAFWRIADKIATVFFAAR